ncbi:MAG: AMP-binding protein, partial [Stellaceae bacterium]
MTADGSAAPAPRVAIPRDFNAAVDLLEHNLAAGRGDKLAFVDDRNSLTYAQLAERVDRAAGALRRLGLQPEQRVMLCLLDTLDFPVAFLGAIKAGIVPVPVNTLLTPADYEFMLRDSRARALIVSDALHDKLAAALANQPALEHVIVAGAAPAGRLSFAA